MIAIGNRCPKEPQKMLFWRKLRHKKWWKPVRPCSGNQASDSIALITVLCLSLKNCLDCWHPLPCSYGGPNYKLTNSKCSPRLTLKIMLKQHWIPHSSSLAYLLFFTQPLCQLPLLCSSQTVKEGEVMSSPPSLASFVFWHCATA